MSMGEVAAAQAGERPSVQALAAEFVGIDGELASLLGPDGMPMTASKATSVWPTAGQTVWVLVVGDQRLMLDGPAPVQRWGRVVSVGTGNAAVQVPPDGTGDPVVFTLPRGVTPQVGDLALISPEHGGLIVAVYPTTGAPTPTPTPTPTRPGELVTREAEVNASWDGTATPQGFWIDGPRLYTRNSQGGPNYATFGYGGGVDRVVPPGARVISAAIYLEVLLSGSGHTAGTHTLSGPSGTPSPANTFAVTPRSGWLSVPVAAAQALADGDARGLTFYGGAGTVYGSRGRNPGNGRLRVRYEVEV